MQIKKILAVAAMVISVVHAVSATDDSTRTEEIKTVKAFFSKGQADGHVRNFSMVTVNRQALSDHYANAIGARLGYKSAAYHGFRVGFAGLFTYNLLSSDLNKPDSISGKLPRYELELFDIENPGNRTDLDRLDELFLHYKSEKMEARAGRFSFTSPLINPQDGRMKPYSVQGVDVQVPVGPKALLTLAWFSHFLPRSTVSWYRAGESIGQFPEGVNEAGNPWDYRGRVYTKGVAVSGIQWHASGNLSTEAWNYYIDNISNTSYGKAVVQVRPKLKLGLEGLYQFRVGNGGNPELELAFFPDQRQWLAGSMLAYEPAGWHFSLSQLHLGNGRFIFPREWGREQFFATLPRGRLEGTGKADLLVLKARKNWSEQFYSEAAVAKAWLPGWQDYGHNKYGATSYWNGVADLHYKPAKPVLQGLGFRLLYVTRFSPDTSLPLRKMFYNTNFHHLGLVTQITF